MKRGIFLSIILGLCLITCIPQVMAQKQSRMEKLLRYLNDNDADKWQKNREKLDDETQTYYSEELALLDVLEYYTFVLRTKLNAKGLLKILIVFIMLL